MHRLLPIFFFWIPCILSAQISGRVTGENGEPLPFASVYVRGTSNGVAANAQGEYRLPTPRGPQEVVFQYMGYRQRVERVTVTDQPLRLNVQMEPTDLELAEVVITGQDPAVAIMRKAIERRRYFRDRSGDHSCDVYIKGFYKLTDAPKKVMGRDLGDMDGMLDSNRTAVVYLSESVSTLYVTGRPPVSKEVMISSKLSGDDQGFSLNRTAMTNFNLYEEYLNVERDLLSPLADQAFAYYNFKLVGKYKDQNGFNIYKIKLLPWRVADPVFQGEVHVVDEQWNLAGVDLFFTGATIKQPVLDTAYIQQQFIPLDQPDRWELLSQITTMKFGMLGFKFGGFFNGVFSNYIFSENKKAPLAKHETFKIDPLARERDTAYWTGIRPIPLTAEETRDYARKDSIRVIRQSVRYQDSIDRKENRFNIGDILTGYDWQRSRRRLKMEVPGIFQGLQFNTVQGYVVNIKPSFTKYLDDDQSRFLKMQGVVNYGFSDDRLRGMLRAERRLEGIYRTDVAVEGGVMAVQFDEQQPISPLVNSVYSLLLERNYLKLYDKSYIRLQAARDLSRWLRLGVQAEYTQRNPLENRSSETWREWPDRNYTRNIPAQTPPGGRPGREIFEVHRAFIAQAVVDVYFSRTYETYPTYRSYNDSKWPELQLLYRAGVPGVGNSKADFQFLSATLRQKNMRMGLLGYVDWSLRGGHFLGRSPLYFMDRYHPLANQTIIGDAKSIDAFGLLPYYWYSTARGFVEGHWQHHMQGWLIDKIPGLSRLHWKEVLTINAFYGRKPNLVSGSETAATGAYWEVGGGFENIGFGPVRPLQVRVLWGFQGNNYDRVGVVLSFDL